MPSTFEEMLAFVAAHLSAPVTQEQTPDGSVYLTGGAPREVIVRVAPSTVTIWEHAVRWEEPQTPVVHPIRIGSIRWRRLSETSSIRVVGTLIDAARESRLSKFRVCVTCETANPPEWMHDDEICQSCAERERRVVY